MATAPQPDRTELKLVRQGDALRIARMSRDLVEHGLPWTWTPRRVIAHIRGRDSNVLGAWHEGRLVGFAIMQFYAERAPSEPAGGPTGCPPVGDRAAFD